MPRPKANHNKFQRTQIIHNMFSDYSKSRLETNSEKKGKQKKVHFYMTLCVKNNNNNGNF